MIEISFVCHVVGFVGEERKKISLPLSTSIINLKRMCTKLFKLSPSLSFSLFYSPSSPSENSFPRKIPMDDETQPLSYYVVDDVFVVVVE
eukprot:TRINITY_DN3641_c0_g4_i2.p1 TRINITY_DN3641_c0_g4~~TRINITY_DN3641_c0_g4_i2.p1  ORF type:complete len:105 (+),score=51.37 TRINITY_DN3641_c0_g4_i2:47-316(+)